MSDPRLPLTWNAGMSPQPLHANRYVPFASRLHKTHVEPRRADAADADDDVAQPGNSTGNFGSHFSRFLPTDNGRTLPAYCV